MNPSRADPKYFHTGTLSNRNDPLLKDQKENRVACIIFGMVHEAHVKDSKPYAGNRIIKDIMIFPVPHEVDRSIAFLDMLFSGDMKIPEWQQTLSFRTMPAKNQGKFCLVSIYLLLTLGLLICLETADRNAPPDISNLLIFSPKKAQKSSLPAHMTMEGSSQNKETLQSSSYSSNHLKKILTHPKYPFLWANTKGRSLSSLFPYLADNCDYHV